MKPKVLVVVGPTASGKTALGVALAKRYGGEVISADSRQVYRGLDLGTGKVTTIEMQGITHHLIDSRDPDETFTVTDFIKEGRAAVHEIHSRGNVPVIVGGTFLYVDALLGNVSPAPVPPDMSLRNELEGQSIGDLYAEIVKKDPERARTIDTKNKRRLIRALEIIHTLGSVPKSRVESLFDVYKIGIRIDMNELKERIHARLEERLNHGMIEEAQRLLQNGMTVSRLSSLGIEYGALCQFLEGKIDGDTMRSQIETKSIQYAKRQLTWLKRDTRIKWFQKDEFYLLFREVNQFLQGH